LDKGVEMKTDVENKKLRLGLIYGLTGGFAFACFAWGIDALLLARANAAFFWIKIIPGLIICIPFGGMIGRLTVRFNDHRTAVLLWAVLALLFSWLVVWLPLYGSPFLLKILDPNLTKWINYSQVADLYQFQIVSLLAIAFAAIISGLLEINLIEQAMLSSYGSASTMAMLVCLILFGLVGSVTDQMININLREPVQVINELFQFAADNQGQEVSKTTAREKHLSSLNTITDLDSLLQRPRQLNLITFDPNFGQMDILVDFQGSLVKCTTIYAQPTDCIRAAETP
jgi:hypothetical protein